MQLSPSNPPPARLIHTHLDATPMFDPVQNGQHKFVLAASDVALPLEPVIHRLLCLITTILTDGFLALPVPTSILSFLIVISFRQVRSLLSRWANVPTSSADGEILEPRDHTVFEHAIFQACIELIEVFGCGGCGATRALCSVPASGSESRPGCCEWLRCLRGVQRCGWFRGKPRAFLMGGWFLGEGWEGTWCRLIQILMPAGIIVFSRW